LATPDELDAERLIPDALDLRVPPRVAEAQAPLDPREVEAR
jgi:hypothetical protein